MTAVDGSLWSLKFEVACYAAAAALLVLQRSRIWIATIAWVASFFIASLLNGGAGETGASFYIGTIAALYRFFGAGVVCYIFRNHIRLRKDLAWAAVFLSIGAILTPFFVDAASVFGSYALLFFAYNCPSWFSRITKSGDISYGTYLYAFPIQQMVLPAVGANPWLMVITAMPLTLIVACLSWAVIEKPALRLKMKTPQSSGPQPSSVLVGGGEAAIRPDLNILP